MPSNPIRPPIIAIARSAAPRHRSSRCSDEQHGGVGVLVQPPQQPDQLVPGHRIQLRGRLVEHDQLRAPRERGAERHALQLAAGELRRSSAPAGGRSPAPARPPPPRARPRPPARRGSRVETPARPAPFPSRSGSRGPGTGCPRHGPAPRDRGRGCPSRPTVTRPEKSPPWKWGTKPLAAPSSVDLPDPEAPATPRARPARVSARLGQRRADGPRIAVADAIEFEHAHRLDPPAVGEREQRQQPAPRSPRAARRRRSARGAPGRPANATSPPSRAPSGKTPAARVPLAPKDEVVATVGPADPRRAARGAVAADLERGGDIERAVEHAGDWRRASAPRERGRPGAAALCVGQPMRVAQQHRHHAGGERRGQRGAKRHAAEQPQHLVGIDRGACRARRTGSARPRAARGLRRSQSPRA